LQLYPRNYSRGVIAKLIFGGKEITGDGAPAGLPLNCRFSDAAGVFSSMLKWRTLILVIPGAYISNQGSCAVFPKTNCPFTSFTSRKNENAVIAERYEAGWD
jgi:hypothetical protein